MIFQEVTCIGGEVSALAQGHATEVVTSFHDVCDLLLSSRGAWRITDVRGWCPDEMSLDSDMRWSLKAKVK